MMNIRLIAADVRVKNAHAFAAVRADDLYLTFGNVLPAALIR